jgi:hypothetical protein
MLLYAPTIIVEPPVLPVFLWLGFGLLDDSNLTRSQDSRGFVC